jgi:hypothetical protein
LERRLKDAPGPSEWISITLYYRINNTVELVDLKRRVREGRREAEAGGGGGGGGEIGEGNREDFACVAVGE